MKLNKILIYTALILLLGMLSAAHGLYRQSARDSVPSGGRLIIKFKPGAEINPQTDKAGILRTDLQALDRINDNFAVNKISPFGSSRAVASNTAFSKIYIIELPDNADPNEALEAYSRLDEVEYCHADVMMELYDTANDPLYQYQWPLNNTGQEYYHIERNEGTGNDILVWQSGTADADIDALETPALPSENTNTIIVAIIDTGVDPNHPELAGKIWTNPREIDGNEIDDDNNGYIDDIHGWDFTGESSIMPPLQDNDPTDEYGHGTHCAGIITANSNNSIGISGVTPNCRIMPIKFFPVMLSSYASEAIIYAADNGADVINMSFGYPWPVPILQDALDYARSKGVVLIAASGNDSDEMQNYPAAYESVIAVGATSSSDQIAFFSTYGDQIDVSAPGYSILSLRADGTDMYAPDEPDVHIIDSLYYIASGTSMACPHVVGIAAFMLALSPGLSMDNVREILENTADDITDPYGLGEYLPGWDKYSGFGRVNLYAAAAQVPDRRAVIQSPQPHEILSGTIDIVGSCDGADFTDYQLSYGPGRTPSQWTEIANSQTPVSYNILGNLAADNLEGIYTFKVSNSGTNFDQITVFISNNSALQLDLPADFDTIVSFVQVMGSAYHPDFKSLVLEYYNIDTPNNWNLITESTQPVYADLICKWSTGALPDGRYLLRLSLSTNTDLTISDTVEVYVRSPFSEDYGWRVNLDAATGIIPNWGDFDNDGVNEIIVGTSDSLYFFNPDGSPKTEGVPAYPAGDYRMAPAVGDLDDDDIEDFVCIGKIGSITKLFGHSSQNGYFETILQANPNLERFDSDLEFDYPRVFLRDMFSDGSDEIFYFSAPACFIYNSNGSFILQILNLNSGALSQYLSADINGDGVDELYNLSSTIYQFNQHGILHKSYSFNGIYGWDFDNRSISAVDIDSDGRQELIVLGRYFDEPYKYFIFAFKDDLSLMPGWPHDAGISNYLVPPTVTFADIDNDNELEYFISYYELTQGSIYAWNLDGSSVLGDSIFPYFTATENPGRLYSSLAGDVNGDGLVDIYSGVLGDIYGTYNVHRIEAWDSYGDLLPGWPVVVKTQKDSLGNHCNHIPIAGDLDKNGQVDMLMTTAKNELMFFNIPGAAYNPGKHPVPFWHYNRRMNGVQTRYTPDCGDLNWDGSVNISDAVFLINYIFIPNSPLPNPLESADVNCDSKSSLVDIIYLINYVFRGGSAPCDTDGDGIHDCP